MIQSIYQNGLRAETIDPLPGSLGASLYSLIQVTFNAELNTGSIVGNIAVFEDKKHSYVDLSSIRNNPQDFEKLEGTFSYRDRVITYTPIAPFKNSTKYIVAIKTGGIKDITGNAVVHEQAFHFVTESDDIEPRVDITTPRQSDILTSLNEVSWNNVGSEAYYVELSKQETFETTSYVGVENKSSTSGLVSNLHQLEKELEDGMYYIRVRALKGPWSIPIQIFIKQAQKGTTSEEDINELFHLLEIGDEPLELLEVFPKEDDANLALSLGMTYFKFKGKIDFSAIDFIETNVEMISIDDENQIPVDVEGSWHHVYDNRENATYIIFKIKE